MGEPHQLGRSGGAARVHVGGDVFGLRLAGEGEPVVRLLRREERKIALGDPFAARSLHREDAHVGRQAVADGRKLLPDLVARRRPEHDHDLGARRADQLDPVRRLEHPVGAAGDAGRQRRQHHGVELAECVGSRNRTASSGPTPDATEQVRGRNRAALELPVGDIDGRRVRIAVVDVADRDLVGKEVEALADPVVAVPREQALLERNALERLHVLDVPQRLELTCNAHDGPWSYRLTAYGITTGRVSVQQLKVLQMRSIRMASGVSRRARRNRPRRTTLVTPGRKTRRRPRSPRR